jgi:hypothetical protein
LLLTALPRKAFCPIKHLIVDDPDDIPVDAYVLLNADLLSSHVLSDYPRMEQNQRWNPLAELLMAMLELCAKRGEESSFFFFFLVEIWSKFMSCWQTRTLH